MSKKKESSIQYDRWSYLWIILGTILLMLSTGSFGIAFAAWIGLLVTAFNLMPIGQLDGGHISYALLGNRQHYLAKAFFISLFPMAFLWPGWLFWAALIFLMRLKHPPTSDVSGGIDRRRLGIGIFCVIIFIFRIGLI